MDALLLVILFAFGFWAGWIVRGAVFLFRLGQNPEKFIDLLEQIKKVNKAEEAGFEPEDAVKIAKGIKIRAEVVSDTFYLYSIEDNQFIAQGPTVEEAFGVAHKRFPGKSFWLEKNNISNQTS